MREDAKRIQAVQGTMALQLVERDRHGKHSRRDLVLAAKLAVELSDVLENMCRKVTPVSSLNM